MQTFSVEMVPPEKLNRILWESVITSYGILTVLYVLETLEEDEFYEECAKIVTVIREVNARANMDNPTNINHGAVKQVREACKEFLGKNVTDERLEETYRHYATLVLSMLGYTWGSITPYFE